MKVGFFLLLLVGFCEGKSLQTAESLLSLSQKKDLFTCVRCGKRLTWQELSMNKELTGQLDLYHSYCKACFNALKTRPYTSLSLTTLPPATFDSDSLDAFSQWKDFHHHDMWSTDDADYEEFSCTVLGWHFRVKKDTNRLYISSPGDLELRSRLDIKAAKMRGYEWGVLIEDEEGNQRMFDIRHKECGLGPEGYGKVVSPSEKSHDDLPDEYILSQPKTDSEIPRREQPAPPYFPKKKRPESLFRELFGKKLKEQQEHFKSH